MIFEVGELDHPSQPARRAGCRDDAPDMRAVVVFFSTSEKHERAELNGAHSLSAQVVDGEVRALKNVV